MKCLFKNSLMKLPYLFSLSLALLLCSNVMAQEIELQVMTKSFQEKISFQEGQLLKIEGTKSKVEVITWDKDFIHADVKMIAKHPELAVAKKEIEFITYFKEETPEEIRIGNVITSDSVVAGLNVIYTISIPKNCKIELANYFGSANIVDLSNGLNIKSEFCNVALENIAGDVKVNTYYGDLIGVMINGDVDIIANRSNVTLSEISGKFDIKANQGIIKVFANQSYLDLTIDAEKTDVYFYDQLLSSYNFNLNSKDGEIDLPEHLLAKYDLRDSGIKNAVIKPTAELSGIKVAINVNYGDIKIASSN